MNYLFQKRLNFIVKEFEDKLNRKLDDKEKQLLIYIVKKEIDNKYPKEDG